LNSKIPSLKELDSVNKFACAPSYINQIKRLLSQCQSWDQHLVVEIGTENQPKKIHNGHRIIKIFNNIQKKKYDVYITRVDKASTIAESKLIGREEM